ncbi:NADH dehydrogenase [ubiquinone] 1 beta subcomplex subunit 2, mitochondrial [Dermatophagoides farinae]|uniref:Mitochondrial nadh-ubiquinone oxidoreductase aggg subunit n=1 Tax=Dermatophagoides farinae TaxID=6954 RepID=A0A922I3S5_DERFA|nr:NADH dehydrogenase [ubiquinone] 1 beta subcomplex subunit 2, mitochondrial-like [Dermatophagoides farinae]KAH7646419.1 mitochondrial nadh-ubiquinone oxidoreductase aggg subunit [Dermatophagoides farinae]KAH9516875.1 NADH dehydrogenase [ubiquinone] 1 beta subcomplex subunit 2, mitochondrial [Dermatophagoides farinae]
MLPLRQFLKISRPMVKNSTQRNSSQYIGYRELNYDAARPAQKLGAELCAGFMWWWIGWHFITDWRHLVGEFIWPQRSEWTNEELGIPED